MVNFDFIAHTKFLAIKHNTSSKKGVTQRLYIQLNFFACVYFFGHSRNNTSVSRIILLILLVLFLLYWIMLKQLWPPEINLIACMFSRMQILRHWLVFERCVLMCFEGDTVNKYQVYKICTVKQKLNFQRKVFCQRKNAVSFADNMCDTVSPPIQYLTIDRISNWWYWRIPGVVCK